MKNSHILFTLFSIVLLFSACRGDQQNKLIGTWEQIPYTNPDSTPLKIYWEFTAGDVVTIYKDNGEKRDSLDYTYNITGSVFDLSDGIIVTGYAPGAGDPRGQYWVDLLTDSEFKGTKRKHPDGTTEGVFLRIELVKR